MTLTKYIVQNELVYSAAGGDSEVWVSEWSVSACVSGLGVSECMNCLLEAILCISIQCSFAHNIMVENLQFAFRWINLLIPLKCSSDYGTHIYLGEREREDM